MFFLQMYDGGKQYMLWDMNSVTGRLLAFLQIQAYNLTNVNKTYQGKFTIILTIVFTLYTEIHSINCLKTRDLSTFNSPPKLEVYAMQRNNDVLTTDIHLVLVLLSSISSVNDLILQTAFVFPR